MPTTRQKIDYSLDFPLPPASRYEITFNDREVDDDAEKIAAEYRNTTTAVEVTRTGGKTTFVFTPP